AAMFWWGRYLSLVKVTVQAFVGDKKVDADIVLPSGEKVKTPGPVRGRDGQKYIVQYKDYEPRTLRFTRGKSFEEVRFPPKEIALIFVAYDMNGNEIAARVSGEGIAPHTTRDRSRLTRPIGTVMTLRFEPLDRRYGPARDQRIEWQDKKTFDRWVNSDASGVPVSLRERLLKNSSDAAHDYPIIFQATGGGGGGKVTSGSVKPSGGTKTSSGRVEAGGGGSAGSITGGASPTRSVVSAVKGDEPIPYEVLSTRLLTPAELKDKSPKTLAIMRNSIFAHHGYKFTKKFWRDYFKNTPADKAGQPLNRFEEANRELIEKEEARKGRWTPPS
ncbi:MAG: YARHG domain-containing protein, partial [Abditibacteriales bacterium]|nr:YARHG domain-containing protein [Abditibacteriales bacterium]